MMRAGFLFLLFLTGGDNSNAGASEGELPEQPINSSENMTDGVSSDRNCRYHDVVEYLNLTRSKEMFTWTRPVLHHNNPTVVQFDMALYAILDVVEKTQTIITYIWTEMYWRNEHISWEPSEFCGIRSISIPKEMVWKPDLTIREMIEKDKAPPSPFLFIYSTGGVLIKNEQVVVSTCQMNVDKFPFDTQSCNITFLSVIHSAFEIQLSPFSDSTAATQWSRKVMQTQDEWEFVGMNVTHNDFNHGGKQEIIYTITIKRRPILHIVFFLLPILFFLCLDLASFLLPDKGGEKLGFKITVLLAVTVLQLILNEILPTTSNSIPLIATYCIVIFALMLMSLLETVFMIYLMERDSLPQETEADRHHRPREECESKQDKAHFYNCGREEKRWNVCSCIREVSGGDTPCEMHPVTEEVSKSTEAGESDGLHLILEEVRRTHALVLRSQKEEWKPGYWARVVRRINKAFFIFYITTVSLFLVLIFMKWTS